MRSPLPGRRGDRSHLLSPSPPEGGPHHARRRGRSVGTARDRPPAATPGCARSPRAGGHRKRLRASRRRPDSQPNSTRRSPLLSSRLHFFSSLPPYTCFHTSTVTLPKENELARCLESPSLPCE